MKALHFENEIYLYHDRHSTNGIPLMKELDSLLNCKITLERIRKLFDWVCEQEGYRYAQRRGSHYRRLLRTPIYFSVRPRQIMSVEELSAWRMNVKDHMLSYEEQFLTYVEEIIALRKAYTCALGILDNYNPRKGELFALMHYADMLGQTISNSHAKRNAPLAFDEKLNKRLGSPPAIVGELNTWLVSFFREFEAKYKDGLQNKYGRQFIRRIHTNGASAQQAKEIRESAALPSEYLYWMNPSAARQMCDDLYDFACHNEKLSSDEKEILLSFSSKELAKKYLKIMDEHIATQIDMNRMSVNSADNVISWRAYTLDEALYQWLLIEVMSKRPVHICSMCGHPFIPDRSNQKYCPNHTKQQINYFTRVTNKKAEEG